jgi:VIT1/CCC1 family predicted Fe2+/Mn2+ transporter
MLQAKQYPPHLVDELTDHIAGDEGRFVEFMMREEFGVGKESDRSPLAAMGLIILAFLVGAALPVVPFVVPFGRAIWVATGASLAGLFVAGWGKGRVSGLPGLRSGAEMALLGAIAAGVTYAVGKWIEIATN